MPKVDKATILDFQFLACLPQTGVLDDTTQARVRGLQMMARLDVTGEPDEATMAALRRLTNRRGMV